MYDEDSPWAEEAGAGQQIANAEYQQLENRFFDVSFKKCQHVSDAQNSIQI